MVLHQTLKIENVEFSVEITFHDMTRYATVKLKNEFYESEEMTWSYWIEGLAERIKEDKEEILKEYYQNKFINKYHWLY